MLDADKLVYCFCITVVYIECTFYLWNIYYIIKIFNFFIHDIMLF